MHTTRLVHDHDSWREAARELLAAHVHPTEVCWRDARDVQDSLFAQADDAARAVARENAPAVARGASRDVTRDVTPDVGRDVPRGVRVPRQFLELGDCVACHASPERWSALYHVLYRLTHGEPALLEVATDPHVHRLMVMQKDVRRDVHKMHAFVRFRAVETESGTTYIAWFEPRHHIVERAVQLFVRRFASMRWSVLTPRGSAHWDMQSLVFGAGVAREGLPRDDELETLWRTYYAHIFNPARVSVQAMRSEMPMRYWKNLPEASLISVLTRDAPSRVQRMLAQFASPAEQMPHDLDPAQPAAGKETPHAMPGCADVHDAGT